MDDRECIVGPILVRDNDDAPGPIIDRREPFDDNDEDADFMG